MSLRLREPGIPLTRCAAVPHTARRRLRLRRLASLRCAGWNEPRSELVDALRARRRARLRRARRPVQPGHARAGPRPRQLTRGRRRRRAGDLACAAQGHRRVRGALVAAHLAVSRLDQHREDSRRPGQAQHSRGLARRADGAGPTGSKPRATAGQDIGSGSRGHGPTRRNSWRYPAKRSIWCVENSPGCRSSSAWSCRCATSTGTTRTRCARYSTSAPPTSGCCCTAAGRASGRRWRTILRRRHERSSRSDDDMSHWDAVDFGNLTCQQFVELVTDYLEDQLDPDARRRFETHLAGCPGCARYIDQIRETQRALGRVEFDTISGPSRAQLMTAFRAWCAARAGLALTLLQQAQRSRREHAAPTAGRRTPLPLQ